MTSDQWIAFLVIVVAAFLGVCAIAAINRIEGRIGCGMTANDVRIRRAEAAERVAEAWLAWCDNGNAEGTWNAFRSAVAEYKAAREAVRKLEGGT